jgi:4-amino-4-deoxy-L-arabinose transferase-like glycosyltransferase
MNFHFVSALADAIRSRPRTVLAWLIGVHLVAWSVVPMLVSDNLQLDLVEGLALGKEWQLGYWKHPPLPWWTSDLAYRLTGSIYSVYVLGPLSAVACLYFVWRFGRVTVGPVTALVAVLALEGLHFINFSAVKFSHDPMQMPFWALTGWISYRALTDRKLRDWILAGACLALAFWAKYTAVTLGLTIGLVLLFDRDARTCWRTAGPYAMAAAFLVVLAPNLWWVVEYDFLPLRYVNIRADAAQHWYQFITFQLEWIVSQVYFLMPVVVLVGVLYLGGGLRRRTDLAPFTRRYLAALALGPFVVTTVIAASVGRMPVSMWGFPFWIFTPLAFLAWFEPDFSTRALRRFATVFVAVFVAYLGSYVAIEVYEPLVHERAKASDFPGRKLADIVTERWHAQTGLPLRYVGGTAIGFGPGEFAANSVAVYSPDRPHVIAHGNFEISPWIDPADVRRSGAVILWQPAWADADLPRDIRRNFPNAKLQPILTLKSASKYATAPVIVGYAFILPQTGADSR